MKLNSFTRSGALHNEDIYEITPTYGFVLDGATGLLKENITGMDSDAQWFVHEWKKFLNKNITQQKPLNEILKDGVKEVEEVYQGFEGAADIKSKPSAGIALYRVVDGKLEYFLLGDCALIITKNNGEVVHLQPQELTKFDDINIKRMAAIAKDKNIDVVEARALIVDYLLETRLTQNTEGGYWILSDSFDAIDNGVQGTMDFADIKQIIAVSDGYSQIYDTFNVLDIENFAKLIEASISLTELYQALWTLQEKDKSCNIHPRFKLRDDATIIVYNA